MKLLVISDVVEPALYRELDPEPLADIDLVISCGDLPPEYLSYLVGALQVPLYYVRGNHDIRYDDKPPEGATDIHGRLMTFRGLHILGIEGSRWYNGGPYQYEESEMKWIIRKLWWILWWRGGVDIVVTHAPPRFIQDAEDRCHRGFRSFHRLINRYNPRYFLHGHIHRFFDNDGDRITRVRRTQVINCYGHYILDITD